MNHDVIVVGSGFAGAVIAARLEGLTGNHRVYKVV